MPRPSLIIRLTHTGQYADGRPNPAAVFVPDLDVGYEYQSRKVPVYVPPGGFIDINASSRSMLSFEQGAIDKFTTANILNSRMFYIPEAYTNASLPSATLYPAGVFVWNTTQNLPNWSNGTSWINGAPPIGPASGDLSGSYPSPLVVGFNGRPIDLSPPSNGDALLYNSFTNQWDHAPITFSGGPPTGPAGGDLAGLYPNPAVSGLLSDPLPASIANGFLKRNAANNAWEEVAYGSAANTVCVGNDARLSDPRTPTGAAGGDLSGTYPNPVVDGLQNRPVAATAPAVGSALVWNGAAWTPQLGGGLTGFYNVVPTSISYNAAAWDVVLANTSAGGITITLPLAASCTGKLINIKKISSDGNVMLIDAQLAELIDGSPSLSVTGQYNCTTLISDGSNWWII